MKGGFSVEWDDTNGRRIKREDYEKLPCYELVGGEITDIVYTEDPAIGVDCKGIYETKTIAGPVMLPDVKMFREGGYYVYFSAETIDELQKNCKVTKIKMGH